MHQRPVRRRRADVERVIDERPGRRTRTGSSSDAPDDLPEVWADPDKFTQVLTNLVENADPARRPTR